MNFELILSVTSMSLRAVVAKQSSFLRPYAQFELGDCFVGTTPPRNDIRIKNKQISN